MNSDAIVIYMLSLMILGMIIISPPLAYASPKESADDIIYPVRVAFEHHRCVYYSLVNVGFDAPQFRHDLQLTRDTSKPISISHETKLPPECMETAIKMAREAGFKDVRTEIYDPPVLKFYQPHNLKNISAKVFPKKSEMSHLLAAAWNRVPTELTAGFTDSAHGYYSGSGVGERIRRDSTFDGVRSLSCKRTQKIFKCEIFVNVISYGHHQYEIYEHDFTREKNSKGKFILKFYQGPPPMID